jgi:hypothetical protein
MEKRLDRITKALGGEERHQVAVCEEYEWPPSAWAELIAAHDAGDLERVADLAERYANCRPVFDNSGYTAIIYSHSGPPNDDAAAVMEAERILGAGSER